MAGKLILDTFEIVSTFGHGLAASFLHEVETGIIFCSVSSLSILAFSLPQLFVNLRTNQGLWKHLTSTSEPFELVLFVSEWESNTNCDRPARAFGYISYVVLFYIYSIEVSTGMRKLPLWDIIG